MRLPLHVVSKVLFFLIIKAFMFFNDTYKLKKIESSEVVDIKIDES